VGLGQHDAAGVEALLREAGSAFSNVPLLPKIAAVGDAASAGCVCAGIESRADGTRIPSGRLRGDARARALVGERTEKRNAVDGVAGVETEGFARAAQTQKEGSGWTADPGIR